MRFGGLAQMRNIFGDRVRRHAYTEARQIRHGMTDAKHDRYWNVVFTSEREGFEFVRPVWRLPTTGLVKNTAAQRRRNRGSR